MHCPISVLCHSLFSYTFLVRSNSITFDQLAQNSKNYRNLKKMKQDRLMNLRFSITHGKQRLNQKS